MTEAQGIILTAGAVFGLFSFSLSMGLTPLVAWVATKKGIVDQPGDARKVHRKSMPLLGGWAPFLSVLLCVVFLLNTWPILTEGEITERQYVGFLLGGFVLLIGGTFDDRYTWSPRKAFIAPIIAALLAVAGGIEVSKLTNPLGGVIYLPGWISDILVFVWLMVVMYTTKFLDGLDGLATGVGSVGVAAIFALALSAAYFQPDVAVLAAVVLGAFLGFLVFNISPASVFLGEGGSTFIGYAVGTLAVISGGKLATALLVLGIPLLDVVWVVLRRWKQGGPRNMFRGDRKHLHHRLLDLGWSHRRIMYTYMAVAGSFGACTLILQSRGKLIALGLLSLLMVFTAAILVWNEKKAI